MSDDDTTAQLPAGEPPPEEPRSGGTRRLLRSRRDRMIAGVAGGLGRYFNVDPVIVRIAFAISVFFGGLGADRVRRPGVVRPHRAGRGRRDRSAARSSARAGWRSASRSRSA